MNKIRTTTIVTAWLAVGAAGCGGPEGIVGTPATVPDTDTEDTPPGTEPPATTGDTGEVPGTIAATGDTGR